MSAKKLFWFCGWVLFSSSCFFHHFYSSSFFHFIDFSFQCFQILDGSLSLFMFAFQFVINVFNSMLLMCFLVWLFCDYFNYYFLIFCWCFLWGVSKLSTLCFCFLAFHIWHLNIQHFVFYFSNIFIFINFLFKNVSIVFPSNVVGFFVLISSKHDGHDDDNITFCVMLCVFYFVSNYFCMYFVLYH